MKPPRTRARGLVLAACLGLAATSAAAASPDCSALTSSPIFQVINPGTGANLLTPWQDEASNAAAHGYTVGNGTPFQASLGAASGLVGAHRMYNARSKDFFWTINANEIASAIRRYGYADQGINFYVAPTAASCTQPVYRFQLGGMHRYAVSQQEQDALTAGGWSREGIAFHGGMAADTDSSMPVGDLDGWRQIFAEDFTTPAPLGQFTAVYGNRWFAYPSPWTDTSGRGTYDPAKVLSVSNGVLDWYLHTDNGTPCVGAVVPKLPGSASGGQTYGKYTFRFRAGTIPGYKLVILLWPDSDNWGEGEIDFPEVGELTAGKDGQMNAYLHAPGAYAQSQWLPTGIVAADTGWHTASIEWRRDTLTYYLDGRLVGTQTSGIPSTPFHLVFQMETNIGGPAPSPSSAGHIQLDWVSIYAPK